MKIYLTRYALTKGILEKEVEETFENMVKENIGGYNKTYRKPFWHSTMDGAIAHAEKMKSAKIASLKKSIEKLEKLDFKPQTSAQ